MTDTQVEKKSTHIDEAIDAKRPLHGNSRRGGDAPPEIQQKIVDIIIEEGQKLNFSYRDIAYFIAIAKRESGFNPDAANSRSTASGISQMVDKAGKKYGLNDQNRFDARANISAGLQYFQHIKQKIAKDFGSSTGKYEALIYYCYHYGEFSVNRRETVKGAVVVKEPYPISQLEGTPKYLDSQKVVDDAEKFEKIFNDSHALKIKLVDILGKAMAGRKVIAVQKIAIPNTNSTSAVPSNMTSSPTSESKNSNPLSNNAAASQATTNLPVPINTANTKEHTTADEKKQSTSLSIDGESTWEVIVKEYVTDADGNLPVIESEKSAAVLILIPRIDVEAYNQAVANNEILEEGNSHRLHSTDKPQSALPTVKTDSKPDSDKTVVAAIPATNSSVTNAVQTKPLAGGKSSALDAAAHDDVKSKQPKPKQSPNLDWNDIYVAMKRLGWEHVYETSFAYAKQFFTQPKLPVQPLASSTPIKAGEPRKQVIGSSIKKEDAKGLKAKEAVTTAVEPAIKNVEVGEDAPWMKFAIEEQGKSGVNKVTEITDSHFSNSEWKLQHKERISAENEIKKLNRELVEEKKKPATHKNPIKVQSPKRIADLEKAIKNQENIRDEADEKMKEIEKSFNNQDIVKYLQSTDLNRDMARDDGTAWCASFLNWCIEATGKYKGLKKDAASAESWRKWGEKISEPRYGAITIVTRASNPVKYHVGFYTGVKDVSVKIGTEEVDVVGKNGKIKKEKKVKYKTVKKVSLLSGNMSNQITESSSWAINESDDPKLHLIEYRWPTVLEKK